MACPSEANTSAQHRTAETDHQMPTNLTCCELRLDACSGVLPQMQQWFGVGPSPTPSACEVRRKAWQTTHHCTTNKRIIPTSTSTCVTPKSSLPQAVPHSNLLSRMFMRPASSSCKTRRPLPAHCERFYKEHWEPWQAMASDGGGNLPCVSYATSSSGIGNWLPSLLDAARTAAEARVPLEVKLYSSQAFWATLGASLDRNPPSCRTRVHDLRVHDPDERSSSRNGSSSANHSLQPRRSWIYDAVQGTNGPNPYERGADMLGCLFTLFTCPDETVYAQVEHLRTRLPRAFVAAHLRFAHQAAGQEKRIIATFNELYQDTPASHWAASENRSLPLGERLAPWDRLLAPVLPSICRGVCEDRRGSEETILPDPFLCCGGRDFEQLGDALAERSHGALAYLTTDLTAFQRFAQRYLPDAFVQQPGAALHSGRIENSLVNLETVADERSAARKTATDFLMLTQAHRVVVLNPSSFSAVAAGLHLPIGALPVHATDRKTCGLRHGRPCRRLRRK
jgi:hypothetical protein